MESAEIIILKAIFVCLVCSLCIRISLSIAKQRWVETYQQTLTYILLPMTTFIITKVISNNIALSLGMVGALSIVRFRNPVKSSMELAIYFCLITIGISAGVNVKYTILLTIVSSLAIILGKYFFDFYYQKLKVISLHHNELESNFYLELKSKEKITDSNILKNVADCYYEQSTNIFSYRFFFRDRKDAEQVYEELLKDKNTTYIKADYFS